MRRSVGDRMRDAVRRALEELGSGATAASVEDAVQRGDAELFGEWRRTTPDPSARAAYLGTVIADARGRRVGPRPPETGIGVWPIGSQQRLHLLGAVRGKGERDLDPLEREFFLHNFGTGDAVDVTVSIAGLGQEFIPRIRVHESVEIEWSEERVHPTDPELPPGEARGYPDRIEPGPELREERCDLRVEFTVDGHRVVLEGWLYFWGGSAPVFFQRTGPAEAPDHARSIR